MMRSNVVLPHPDGPSRTRNSPSLAVSVMPSTAVTGPNSFLIALAVTEATSTSHVLGPCAWAMCLAHVLGMCLPARARASGECQWRRILGLGARTDAASAATSPFDQERLAHFS